MPTTGQAQPAEASAEGQTTTRAAAAITGAIAEGLAELGEATERAETKGQSVPEASETPSAPVGAIAASVDVDAVALDAEGGVTEPQREEAAPDAETEAAAPEAAPEQPSEPSPAQAVAPAARAVSGRAAASAAHQPESAATGAAIASSNAPEVTGRRSAAARGAAQASEAPTGEVDRQSFRQQLREAIENAMPPPQNEDDAKRLMDEGGEDAAREIQGSLGGHTAAATGGLPAAVEEGNQPTPTPEGEAVPLAPEPVGVAPAGVAAGPVVPPPSTPQAVDMSPNRAETDALAAENNVTDTMLERGNDPQFTATLGARGEAERHSEEGPQQLREAEAGDRSATHDRAAGMIATGLSGFHATRATQLNEVAAQQAQTSGLTTARKAEITATIEGIGERTRTDVTDILTKMTEKVGETFQTAIDEALEDYNDAFDDVRGGFLTRFGDFLTGSGDARFKRALAAGRLAFKARIDRAIDDIATFVEAELARARARVQEGRDEIDTYINETLPENEREFAGEASQSISEDFEALEGEISSSRDAMISNMVDMYREGIQRRNAREEELRLANRSLWERVYDATVGVVQKVLEFKNMLLGILARAASVVTAIIEDPIQFLKNLIAGIKAGLDKFMGNIVENLKQALMGWLFGALEGAGLQLPETWDLKGFLSVVLQVLGLTKENVRARAVRILGEDMVAKIETGVEILRVLFTEGPAGLWQMLLEKLGDIKETILAEIRSWVITKIVEAGIKWLIGLLNPAGAFVKACMMIYDIVVFFIERGQQIIAAVNAIINSLGVIVAGNIGAMATAVEGALNRILPVVIGFLASLLGLGGISDKIRQFMEAVQRPVNKAIDWIINKGVALARRVKGLLGGDREDQADDEPDDPEKELKVQAAMEYLHQRERAQAGEGGITLEEAEQIATDVRANHPVIKSMRAVPDGRVWSFEYTASPGKDEEGTVQRAGGLTVDEIQRAKEKAWKMVRDEMQERVGEFREAEDRGEAMPVDTGEDVLAHAAARRGAYTDVPRSTEEQSRLKMWQQEERQFGGESVREQRRFMNPSRMNFFMLHNNFAANYQAHGAEISAAASEVGLTRSQMRVALEHFMRNMALPQEILERANAPALHSKLAYLMAIFSAEAMRLDDTPATIAVGADIAQRRDEADERDITGPMTTETAHGATQGATTGRRRAAITAGTQGAPRTGTAVAGRLEEYDRQTLEQIREWLRLRDEEDRVFDDEDELAQELYVLIKATFGVGQSRRRT